MVSQDKNYNLNKDYSNFNLEDKIKRQSPQAVKRSISKGVTPIGRIMPGKELQDWKKTNDIMPYVLKRPNLFITPKIREVFKTPSVATDWSSMTSLRDTIKTPSVATDWSSMMSLRDTIKTPSVATDWSSMMSLRDTIKTPSVATDWSSMMSLRNTIKTPSVVTDWSSMTSLRDMIKTPSVVTDWSSMTAFKDASRNPLASIDFASISDTSNSLTELSALSKVNLTANAFKQQVSIFNNENQLTPLLVNILENTKCISEHIKDSKVNFLESPISTEVFISRINKLPSDYHLTIPEKDNKKNIKEDKDDIYLENKKNDNKVSLNSTISSFGVLDLIPSITETEAMDFYNHLAKYPMLGLNHKVGRKILEWVESVSLIELRENTHHFRARIRPLNQDRPFTELEMWEAPHGMPGHGRFNPIGHSVLYTSNTPDAAAVEVVKGEIDNKVDIIKWALKEKVKILDMPDKDYPLFRYCQFSSTSETNVKPEYLIPNFLSQCCQIKNIMGLRFISDRFPDAYNYAFFDFPKSWFEYKKLIADFN